MAWDGTGVCNELKWWVSEEWAIRRWRSGWLRLANVQRLGVSIRLKHAKTKEGWLYRTFRFCCQKAKTLTLKRRWWKWRRRSAETWRRLVPKGGRALHIARWCLRANFSNHYACTYPRKEIAEQKQSRLRVAQTASDRGSANKSLEIGPEKAQTEPAVGATFEIPWNGAWVPRGESRTGRDL